MPSLLETRGTTKNRKSGLFALIGAGVLLCVSGFSAHAQVSVTTWQNDIGRTGQNLNETILNTSDVNATQFGKLFSQSVDGFVYAQPLYLPNVTIGGQSHNVVFVATENDSVYAFDADSNGGANASPLWFASMLTAAHGAASGATAIPSTYTGTDLVPQVGITGTPVIDPSSGTIYLVSASLEGASFVQRLHALDITSGAEKFGGPVFISASVAGNGNGSVNGLLTFDPEWENQRAGLLLLNGVVYIGFASHGDNGPWHGWILSYNAHTLQQIGALCDSHNGVGSGVWMSGAGLAADVVDSVNHPYGRMFIATGNGDYTASAPFTTNMDFGDSILNLDLTGGVPNVQDAFTPYNQAQLDANDSDQASGGVLVLPNQTSGSNPHLLVQTGKSGTMYLLNRDNLGGYNTAGDTVLQEKQFAVGNNGAWSTGAYWNGSVYYWGVEDKLKKFPLVSGLLTGPSATSSETYGYPGATPAISANGNTQGIVWSIESDAYTNSGPAILQAHDATNPATTLYSSNTNLSRDNPGPAVKFTVPTIANGKVFVGTQNQVSVFGLLNGQQVAAAPAISPAGKSFNGSLTVTMTDSTPGATIYYTLDGTTPTSSSAVYSSPLTLTSSVTIEAMASAQGYLQSAVTTENYVDSSQVAAPVFTPAGGTFTAPVSVAMSDSTTGATIYYTTDGSTPTTSSTPYTGPIVVGATQTLSAIAVASGFANSPVQSQTYTLNIGQTGINFPVGFAGTQGTTMIFNGNTGLDDTRLQLTNGGTGEASSAWYYQQVNVQAFTTEFSFQLSNPAGDGMTFAIQGQNLAALGQSGGSLGYQGIPSSIAVKFDLFSNSGEGPDSTGLYLNGASPTVPAVDMSASGVDLHSGDTMDVVISYNGSILNMTIKDLVTAKSFTTSWTVNIPGIVGGNTAWVGFTGGTGGNTSSQKVLTWTYTVGSNIAPVVTAPTFSPGAGTYSSPQSVTISDATAGSTIYYTTDGTTPTTSSTVYTAPIAISSSETLKAIAVESGYTNSSVATAAYNFGTALPAPTISLASGTYSTPQSVTITDTIAGTAIYYTTNGTMPTTSSTVYSGPITVSSTETLEAIAVENGYLNSPAATAAYTFSSGGTIEINYPSGQFTYNQLTLSNGASVTGGLLQVTDGGVGEYRSAFYNTQVPIQTFINDFTFQQLNANADGMTFTIQNAGYNALGGSGGGLGYQGIPSSVAIKFDLFSNQGEGPDSTGLYTNGASPTLPSVDLSSTGINLHSGDVMRAHMVYDGVNLTMTLTDTVTNATVTETFPINIPATVGGNTAYVGFTGGTGGSTATQNILSWTLESSPAQLAATPTFSPAPGPYTTTQSVTISDATAGTKIYYTTNGTTPTTSSTVYSGPITVSATETIKAIAAESGYTTSAVATAAYTIGTQLPTPTFSVVGGTYSSAQTVSISDATAGTTIYYTINGTTPTTSSAVYSGPITVSSTETLEAIAVETGYTNSPVASVTYTITPPLPTPAFSPAAGTYSTAQTVTISDATAGTTIYYTTNGTTPTTSSTVYSGPITVSSTETLKAIAVESGYATSSVGSAAYTISAVLSAPTFSPGSGTYTSAQTVTLADAVPGATIYYTTNGTTPTTSSAVYSSPITVSSSATVEAIAVASGYINSTVATAVYTINTASTSYINFGSGQFTASSLSLNNGASVTGGLLQITDGGAGENRSAWFKTPVPVTSFIADFTFQLLNPNADGMTFAIQNSSPTAVGSGGGGLGYQNIANSIAVKFDLFSNSGEGPDSTGVYIGGAAPTVPSTDLSATPINLHSGDPIHAHILYDGTNLIMTLTDTVTNGAVTEVFPVNIPAAVGGNTAYVGFTGGTGGSTATQNVLSWTFVSPAAPTAATPTFSPAPGPYTTTQSVTISDATAGTKIYYTTNGTTPTTSSTVYSGPITVSATETIKAIAAESGYTTSSVATAAYTIGTQLPAPTFSLAAGTYSSAQTVSISDATAGTTIYYTTNGTTPTTSSAVYSGPITVSSTETLEAIAVETGYTNSLVATATYTIATPLPTPTFSPAAGTYSTAQTVTISDSTAGTTIYYTTNGTTPTTSSTVYGSPITVSSTQTLKAIAVKSGYSTSSVGSAAYTISAVLSAPTFSPGGGTYTSAQTVTLADATPGATIYYTTNGTTPTTSSSAYTSPITVSSSETVEAIAVASGYTNSPVATAIYTISTISSSYINVGSSQFTASLLNLNNGASVTGGLLQITDGGSGENRSAWFKTPVPVASFITDFTFQLLNPNADGMTFAIQNSSPTAVGAGGGGLGYQNIGNSVAVKFDLFSNTTEGPDSTGVYTGGAAPITPSTDLSSTPINLHSGDPIHAHILYDGTNLTMTLTDTVTNGAVTEVFPVNIPAAVGGNTAYVGFTGGTGGSTATQNVLSWSYVSPALPLAATPTFSPAPGAYTTAQSVTIADATSGATIYYTTNGTTPTTSSAVYSAPITVSSSETLEAIAVASGYTTSSVASAVYNIGAQLPAPTFSVIGGTYAAAQTVTISDATAGAAIYYTTNGTAPTTSSTLYTGPVTVSATETVEAIAVETGYLNSSVSSVTYTIAAGNTTYINYASGPFTASSFDLINGASVTGGILQITDGGQGENRAAWFSTPVPVQKFITDFTFQQLNPVGDGMTFAIQNAGPTAVGGNGGGLGYQYIANSVAVKFDIFSNAGEGSDSTGLYTNGASPTLPSTDLSSTGINLLSGHTMAAHIVYDGTNLTMTLTDTVTNGSVTEVFPVNIPSVVGGNTAYVGFTGGTGGNTVTQNVLSWSYSVQ